MSGDCSDRCEAPTRGEQAAFCPECAQKGKPVSTLTVKSLAREHRRVLPGSYFFCRMPDCDVVYFSGAARFGKRDVKVRVGVKERQDPIPLCYCFDYTRADIRQDIESQGATDILERIKAEVKAGFCACAAKNPSGDCCLGDITRAIQQAKALRVAVP